MTLKEVAVGSTAKVKKITGAGPLRRRIMDMGITKGVDVYVRDFVISSVAEKSLLHNAHCLM